ncbi:MAG: [FeFe] hydrogenase H-cluster radical SAM maturase HydG [Candidatus Kapabacteria bacterium]|nr:[FeFe] hydrogenase H-cluster radical SAM maturase HydG [Candidatus Kapabacteria bacterium]
MFFIDENYLHQLIDKKEKVDSKRVDDVLSKARELKGLELEEVAVLLNIDDSENLNKLFSTALFIKEEIYGNRLVLFAPLYISNYCSNNCLYCGFRADNKAIERRTLSLEEIKEETKAILEQGHKRILMLMGENHKQTGLDYLISAIDSVYSVKDSKGSSIRRINIEIAPLTDNEFKVLRDVKIGTYTVFQETYHYETYNQMHPSGKKSDYEWRLFTMDRALSNGMADVGIGALFGLYDYKFEVLALIQHSKYLDEKFGIGPHTISIPRIKPAINAPASQNIPHQVSDNDFKKLVAVIRCAVPYTGMILSTREPKELRSELFNYGISQISAGSKTNIGGYKQALGGFSEIGQFSLNDCRTSGEVIQDVIKQGYIPSFCTACYRLGRVGEDFMDQAKPGLIKIFCQPNALTTLKEYLIDYADEETKKLGDELIKKELETIPNEHIKNKTIEYLKKIEEGERDLYF